MALEEGEDVVIMAVVVAIVAAILYFMLGGVNMIDERTPRTLTQDEQDACWRIFVYEADMFIKTSDHLSPDDVANGEFMQLRRVVKNAVIESCVLHCRNVCEVLLSVGRGRDDIRLVDMLPDFHHRALDDLRTAYGLRARPGDFAHVLHYQALQPWVGRRADGDYGPALCTLRPIILVVLQEIADYAGDAIHESLDRCRRRES